MRRGPMSLLSQILDDGPDVAEVIPAVDAEQDAVLADQGYVRFTI